MLIRRPLYATLVAEFIGTFTLCAVGIGTILTPGVANLDQPQDLLAIAFAHGLAIAVMVTAMGHTSGAHFNPAVTVAAMATRLMGWVTGVWYILAQLLGAVAGAAVIRIAYGEGWNDAAASVTLTKGVSMGQGIMLEALATFFLVWVIFAVAVDRDGAWVRLAGWPIGFTVLMDILMIGPLTGGAMNPARWFGPNLLTGQWDNIATWIAGPLIGGLVAGFLYMLVMRPRLHDPV